MNAQEMQAATARGGDSYDLAVGLRQRLADAAGTRSPSVASQLQSAARERLESGRASRGRERFRLARRRRSDVA